MNIWTSDDFIFKPVNENVYRIKLDIDNSKIDGELTDFPISVSLSSDSGQNSFDTTNVFDKLASQTNRKKMYFIDSGSNKLFTEIERWDQTNKEANLWVKVSTIVSGTDTELYLYYSSFFSDQITYVGDTGDVPAQSVWDNDFKAVWHMAQDPYGGTDCMLDSTSNLNHGTPAGTMLTEDLVDGKIGKAIDFDGNDDLINYGTDSSINFSVTDAITAECVFKTSETKTQMFVTRDDAATPARQWGLHINSDDSVAANIYQTNSTFANVNTNNGLGGNYIDGAYHYAAVTLDAGQAPLANGLYSENDPTPTSATLANRPCLVDGQGFGSNCGAYIQTSDDSAGVDIGSVQTIVGMAFTAHGNVGSSAVYRYFGTDTDSMEVYKSDNNSSWTLVEQFTDMLVESYSHPAYGTTWIYWTVTFSTPQTARYFKMNTVTFGPPKTTNINGNPGTVTLAMDEIEVMYVDAYTKLYIDGVLNVTSTNDLSSIQSQPSVPTIVGDRYNESSDYNFKGVLDEIRLSSAARNAPWVKATYYSNWDDLITYSEAETLTPSSYVEVYGGFTETLSGTLYHNGVVTSVWANNDYLYVGTVNSGIIWSPMSSISGAVYDDFSIYKTYPDICNSNVNYVHGAGNYLCVTTISGVNIIDLTTNSGIYTNTSIIADKCHQMPDTTSYYIYDDKLRTVYSDTSTYLYQSSDDIIPSGVEMNDLYVVSGTKNLILLATTDGVVMIEENKGNETNSRFKYYYIEG